MPTVITHGVVGYLGARLAGPRLPPRLGLLAMACSMAPDLDSVAFALGIPYGHIMGHRGFSHSPLFALLLALIVCLVGLRQVRLGSRGWWVCYAVLTLATASHGVLDAMTTAPYGVAFLFPLTDERFLLPWQLMPAVSVGKGFFLNPELSTFVMMAEIQIVWLPLLAIWVAVGLKRLSRAESGAPG